MSASPEVIQKLVALHKEELEILRERDRKFDDRKKRMELSGRYFEVGQKIGEIIYNKEVVGEDFHSNDGFYAIPEVREDFDEMLELETSFHERELLEEEAKCKTPKPEPYLDVVEAFHINGNIVITDPCYIRNFVHPTHSRSTLYGDWGCSVWYFDPRKGDTPKKGEKPFGEFCADSGQVCVTALDKTARKKVEEWLKNREWCGTIIEGFDGTVEYVERVSFFAHGGEWHEERELIVRGKGTKNGKPFGFITAQTSL